MKLDWLKPLAGRPGPYATVHLDTSRGDTKAEREVRDRWQALRRELLDQGADLVTVEALDAVVTEPTGIGGPQGRVLVASGDEVLVDRVLSMPPARDEAVFGPAPALLGPARSADEAVDYLLVEVDRTGADLTRPAAAGPRVPHKHDRTVEGGHDELRKGAAGGTDQARFQARAEDSWERNAEAVAAELDRIVATERPEAVLLTGDVRAVALVKDAVGTPVTELLVEVAGGSRAEGVKEHVFRQRVTEALEVIRVRRREAVLDQYRAERNRAGAAVTELGDVVDALRRAQVSELVLDEAMAGPGSTLADRTLWVGSDPLQLAMTEDDLKDLGVAPGQAHAVRADIALVGAALRSDSGVTFADTGAVDLVDGVGAVLRYQDASTPDEQLFSRGDDTERMGRRHAVSR